MYLYYLLIDTELMQKHVNDDLAKLNPLNPARESGGCELP